jgi:hypothetical protein
MARTPPARPLGRWLLPLVLLAATSVPGSAWAQADPGTGDQPPNTGLIHFTLFGAAPTVVLEFPETSSDLSEPDYVQITPLFQRTRLVVSCRSGSPPDPCLADVAVPLDEDVDFTFPVAAAPWRYPVKADGYACFAHQSIEQVFITLNTPGKRADDVALKCHVHVDLNFDIEALWRSGVADYCYQGTGNAPAPSAATLWEYAVADYPDQPAAPPQDLPSDCGAWPPRDPKATQDG